MYRIKFEFEDIYVSDIVFTDGIVKRVFLTSNVKEALLYPAEKFCDVCERAAQMGKYFSNTILVQNDDSWETVERY